MKDLLSIFIPTYNRAILLDEILERVIEAVSKEFISIYISDNCSTDNTEEIVLKWQKQYSFIEYNKNKQNIGADRNMLKILNCNASEYVLMLGDDDYVTVDFLEKIVPYLKENYDFIVLGTNCNYQTKIYNSVGEAFGFLYDKMPYGTLIMRSGTMTMDVVDKYIGTYHAYSAVAWEAACLSYSYGKILYYNESEVVVLGQGNKTWSSNAIDVFLYGIPKWYSLLPIDSKIKSKVYKGHKRIYFNIKMFANMKLDVKKSNLTSKIYFNVMDEIKWFIVEIIPSGVIKCIKKAKSRSKQ